MELKEIRVIIDLMKKNDLALFQLEREGFKIKLQRGAMVVGVQSGGVAGLASTAGQPVLGGLPVGQLQAGAAEGFAPLVAPGAAAGSVAATADGAGGTEHREIRSPMVGTFYQAASPESPVFVKVGQEVDEETVVCIIEAMKVMNEIKAEIRGVIAEIVAENGKPVQFGQVLFKVK